MPSGKRKEQRQAESEKFMDGEFGNLTFTDDPPEDNDKKERKKTYTKQNQKPKTKPQSKKIADTPLNNKESERNREKNTLPDEEQISPLMDNEDIPTSYFNGNYRNNGVINASVGSALYLRARILSDNPDSPFNSVSELVRRLLTDHIEEHEERVLKVREALGE